MKLKEGFFYTIKEDIKDEDSKSGNLLVRSGMIKKTASGIYMYMPLGLKVLAKIENIIREEMNKAGAYELLMPTLIPEDVYEKSGRRAIFGSNMFSLKDRYNRNYVLGPTHEELFVSAAKMQIKSYKDMPFNIYQIGTKYRDETRPRFGLIRVREFAMKDAYSFDATLKGLDKSYQKMNVAYKNIFDRIGIDYKIVKADTGAMGGLLSEEFQAVTDIGEDTLVLCDTCDYASNIEVSECALKTIKDTSTELPIKLVSTPNQKEVEKVSQYLNVPLNKIVKTLIYKADDKLYAALILGTDELNEVKLAKTLGVSEVELASKEEIKERLNLVSGYLGPIDLNIPLVADQNVLNLKNFVVGANKENYHYQNVNLKDLKIFKTADIINVQENDRCPLCGGKLYFKKGIEIGNIFKLGDKYSASLGLTYLDKNNKTKYVQMGCYGIGVGRIMAALAEQKADDKGLVFPFAVAPFEVAIITLNSKDLGALKVANSLYAKLKRRHIDVLLDNRDERAGVKFHDMDLIGVPLRITIGKDIVSGKVEFKLRDKDETILVDVKEAINKVKEIIKG